MITNLNKVSVKINVGSRYWKIFNNDETAGWVKDEIICARCKQPVDSSQYTSKCPHCESLFAGVIEEGFNFNNINFNDGKLKANLGEGLKLSDSKKSKTLFQVIEHSAYRFDILKINVKLSGEFISKINPYYIPEEDRSESISYGTGLTSYYMIEYVLKDFKIEFLSCFSYDLDKKPNERITLEKDKPGNFLEFNKENVYSVYQDERCSDIKKSVNRKTKWICEYIYDATASKMLKNTILNFQEPPLKLELAIKHNISSDDMIIKNPNATKLHEILGVSKACLKFIIDPDLDKYSEIEKVYKTNFKKKILELYYNLGDRYRKFFKDMEIFFNDKNCFDTLQAKEKIAELYYVGYDLNRLYQYLTEECKWQQGLNFPEALTNLYDYVNMCEEMELKDYDRYPKALRTRHDVMVMRYNSISMNQKEQANFDNVVSKYKKLEYKNSKYILRIAKTPKELVHEGNDLNHCVGSYADKMASESNVIFFLRDINEPDKSLVTIEINKDGSQLHGYTLKLGQCKGLYNRSLVSQEKSFVNEFTKKVLNKAYIDDNGEIQIRKTVKKKVTTIKDLEQALIENDDTLSMLKKSC